MDNIYELLNEYRKNKPCINTHSHHMKNEFFHDFDLDKLLKRTYISWSGVDFDNSDKGRADYLDKVRYKSYFIWLIKSIQEIYKIDNPLTLDSWKYYSDKIKNAYKDENWHMSLLKNNCRYEKIILDTYWEPGDDNGYPELFTPTFRINIFLYGYNQNIIDSDDNSFFNMYGRRSTDIDDYIYFMRETISNKIRGGCVALKSASAYDRGLDFAETSREKAQKALMGMGKEATEEDIKAFQDYVFFQVCKIAAELDVPIQCHTGLGKMYKSNAMQLQEVISKNPDTKFVLFHCGYPWMDDIGGLLHAYPNVYPDLCWLPLISPTASKRMLHELIEVGTYDKVCWGCDTWTSEESYGALLAIRHTLASVLSEKIKEGYLCIEDAKNIIDNILYKNASRLYKLRHRIPELR